MYAAAAAQAQADEAAKNAQTEQPAQEQKSSDTVDADFTVVDDDEKK